MAFGAAWIYGRFGVFWSFNYLSDSGVIQTVLVIATISAAVFYLGREAYKRFFKKDSSCEGCAFNPETHRS
ncbi:MAG: hypothetical protein Crog4KO_08710 [Crocinitomicaceae bacterium]